MEHERVTDNLMFPGCSLRLPGVCSMVSTFNKRWFRKWSDVEKVSSITFYSFMLLNNLSYRVPFVPSRNLYVNVKKQILFTAACSSSGSSFWNWTSDVSFWKHQDLRLSQSLQCECVTLMWSLVLVYKCDLDKDAGTRQAITAGRFHSLFLQLFMYFDFLMEGGGAGGGKGKR